MSQIGTLVTGAAVQTLLVLNNLHQFIQIGTIDTDLPIEGLTVSISGRTPIDIQDQSLIQAFAKYSNAGLLGADVKKAMVIPIADGGKGNISTRITLTNAGATTPDIFGWSRKPSGGNLVAATVQTVNENANYLFENFQALMFDATNFLSATITFRDPVTGREWVEGNITADELAALFATRDETTTDADGLLAGITVVDGQRSNVKDIRIFSTGGQLDVLVVTTMPV